MGTGPLKKKGHLVLSSKSIRPTHLKRNASHGLKTHCPHQVLAWSVLYCQEVSNCFGDWNGNGMLWELNIWVKSGSKAVADVQVESETQKFGWDLRRQERISVQNEIRKLSRTTPWPFPRSNYDPFAHQVSGTLPRGYCLPQARWEPLAQETKMQDQQNLLPGTEPVGDLRSWVRVYDLAVTFGNTLLRRLYGSYFLLPVWYFSHWGTAILIRYDPTKIFGTRIN